MSLKGGSIWINKTTNEEIEDILKNILADSETRIELLKEASFGPECVYKLQFDNTRFSTFFEVTGNSVSPRVLIIKVLTHDEYYNEDTKVSTPYPEEHSFEVNIHRRLSLSDKNHYPICPGFLYSKVTKLGVWSERSERKPRTLEENFCGNLYKIRQRIFEEQEQDVMEDGKIQKRVIQVPLNVNLYERLADETVRLLRYENPRLPSTFKFRDATQTIIFMEYLECATLSTIIKKSRRSDKVFSDYMSNLHGMKLPFVDTRISRASKETRIRGFACFVLLYLSILLLNEGIIHGDLHPGNVLICRRADKIDAVVIDFGRSAFTESVYINKHLEIDKNIETFLLKTTLLTIFDEITASMPKDVAFVERNMAPYFDHLIANKEYEKAAIATTMCRSTNTKPTRLTVYDFYIDQIYSKEIYQLYMYIFQYTALSREYNFTRLIKEALKARERFNNNLLGRCQYLMKMHGIGSSADYIDWLKKNHPDKGGTIDSGIFTELTECHKAREYYKRHPIAQAAREKDMAETKARLARDRAADKAAADKAVADEKAAAHEKAVADEKAASAKAVAAKAIADEKAAAAKALAKAIAEEAEAERDQIQAQKDKIREEARHKSREERSSRYQEEAIWAQARAIKDRGTQVATEAAKQARRKQEEREKARRKQEQEEAQRQQEEAQKKQEEREKARGKQEQEEAQRQQEQEEAQRKQKEAIWAQARTIKDRGTQVATEAAKQAQKKQEEREKARRKQEQEEAQRQQEETQRQQEEAQRQREQEKIEKANRVRTDNLVNNLAKFDSVNEQRIKREQERLAALEMQERAAHDKTKKKSVLSGFRRGISNLVSLVRGTQSKKTNTPPISGLPFSRSSARTTKHTLRGSTSAPIYYYPEQSGLPQYSGQVRIGGKRRTFKHHKKTKNKKRRKRKTKARH